MFMDDVYSEHMNAKQSNGIAGIALPAICSLQATFSRHLFEDTDDPVRTVPATDTSCGPWNTKLNAEPRQIPTAVKVCYQRTRSQYTVYLVIVAQTPNAGYFLDMTLDDFWPGR